MKNKKRDPKSYDSVILDEVIFIRLIKVISKEENKLIWIKKKKYYDKNKKELLERDKIDITNFINASMKRIEDTRSHLLKIQTDVKNDPFVFYDFMNCSETMISCILLFTKQFDADPDDFEKSKKVFLKDFQTGKNYSKCNNKKNKCKTECFELDSDWNYFKYLRSLCSVHPTETTYHCRYLKSDEEWCPNIEKFNKNSIRAILVYANIDQNYPDYEAIVLTGDLNSRKLDIWVSQIFNFVDNAYSNLMNLLINTLENYQKSKFDELTKKLIPNPQECKSYNEYLDNIENAIIERCGLSFKYLALHWKRILRTEFSNPIMKSLLEKYKIAVINDINAKRQMLQSLDTNDLWGLYDLPLSENIECEELKEFTYQCEKMSYLRESEEDYNDVSELNDSVRYDSLCNPEEKSNSELHRWRILNTAFRDIEKMNDEKRSNEDLRKYTTYIDYQLHVTNSEWARIQLKTIEYIFGNEVIFDYGDSDWNLYMQYHVACWALQCKHLIPDESSEK